MWPLTRLASISMRLRVARILHRVGEQVLDRLFGGALVGEDARQVRLDLRRDREVALRELRLHPRQHLVQRFRQVGGLHAIRAQARFHAREVEDVLDQPRQLLRLAVDDPVVLLRALGRAHAAELERLGKQLDQRERRLEVVRHRRDEIRLELGERALRAPPRRRPGTRRAPIATASTIISASCGRVLALTISGIGCGP